jgi:hypothetical protein
MPHGGAAGGLLRAFDGPTLLLCAPTGDIEKGSLGGLYHHDTRYLSEWQLTIDGTPLTCLTSQPLGTGSQLFYLTNPATWQLPEQAVTVRRHRAVGPSAAGADGARPAVSGGRAAADPWIPEQLHGLSAASTPASGLSWAASA